VIATIGQKNSDHYGASTSSSTPSFRIWRIFRRRHATRNEGNHPGRYNSRSEAVRGAEEWIKNDREQELNAKRDQFKEFSPTRHTTSIARL